MTSGEPQSFSWRGREVVWTRWGTGPAVVFCHGTPWSSVVWRPFAEALSTNYTVHLWDMAGYGQSSKLPQHSVDLGTQGELLVDLLDHWGLDAPHLVAHDFGGAVFLRAALLGHARFASACLVDVVALRPWGSDFFRLVGDNAEVFAALPAAVHRGAVEAYIRGASTRRLSDTDMHALVQPWLGPSGQAAFYRQIQEADERFTAEVEPLLGSLAMPVRIVWGTADAWIPADMGVRLQEAIPGATLRLVPDAGHLVQYDAPAILADELRSWLSGLEVGTPAEEQRSV
jgi:pimeloyl-ACP methyl ester carboxylesterase